MNLIQEVSSNSRYFTCPQKRECKDKQNTEKISMSRQKPVGRNTFSATVVSRNEHSFPILSSFPD